MRPHRLLLFGCLLLSGSGALGASLELPLKVPLETLRAALPNEVYREGPCRYLELEATQLDADNGHLRLSGRVRAALGVEVLGKCQGAADWRGSILLRLVPRIDEDGRLRVRVVDSSLTGERGDQAAALIWEASRQQLHPRLERFAYDLGASRAALLPVLRGAAPPGQAAAMEQALNGLRVLEPRVESAHVVVPVALEVPDAWLAAPPLAAASAAPLTEAEVDALEKALEPFDAFLVYSLRQIAADSQSPGLRKRLFTLLLDSRYQLISLLSGDAAAGPDPVRALFLDTWSSLREIVAETKRYALFIDAGDALLALERAAPGLPLSAEGLRQLARSLRPAETGDPLAYDWATDSELQRLFEVEEPAEPGRSSLGYFLKAGYVLAQAQAPERWVPSQEELPSYEKHIGALLAKAGSAELQRSSLPAPYQKVYAHLVPTTALIESCWRQFVVRQGKPTYVRSGSGSVGIMQINQRVWRGFYDVERLRWDTAYNARAGAQILMRYVKDYAIPYAERKGDPGRVARAAYAVYNAGPRAVGRIDKNPPHPREARVDEKLWTLYRGIASGGQPDLKSCGVKTAD